MNSKRQWTYICVVFIWTFVNVYAEDYTIEAEDMTIGSAPVIRRLTASGNKSVLLLQGGEIHFELCIMEATDIRLSSVVYSNDGPSDKVRVQIDDMNLAVIETVTLMDGGRGWGLFRSFLGPFASNKIIQGRHLLKVTVLQSDPYGVEIDAITIRMDTTQPKDLRSCDVYCFDKVRFFDDVLLPSNTSPATAFQKSYKTTCAEVDNVNVPVLHESAKKFVVTASFPKYTTFENNRNVDWSGCAKGGPYYKFVNLDLLKDQTMRDGIASLSISTHHEDDFGHDNYDQIGEFLLSFSLPGPKAGSMDTEIGSLTFLKNLRYNGTMTVTYEYYNRYGEWTGEQSKSFTNYLNEVVFKTPNFSYREGPGNFIKIKFHMHEANTDTFQIEELFMTRSGQKGDTSTTIYKDANTAVEIVDIELWWRINETMTITLTHTGEIFHNADYFRLVRRVPWMPDNWSQVFVMYQDGNIRLLTLTPHGLDWIPFGSSVIVGQTDPSKRRPCAPIDHVNIDPRTLHLEIFYKDGGRVDMNVLTTVRETKLQITDSTFAHDLNKYPFFTFRSMYVADGNSDVDHISVDNNNQTKGIMEPWGTLQGTYFAFFRKCISIHNTLSPDISLEML